MGLLRGIEWRKSDMALKELKEMLWGLEALECSMTSLREHFKRSKRARKK